VHFATAHAVSTIEVFIPHVQRNSPRLILGYSSPKVIYFRLTLRTITQLLYSRNLLRLQSLYFVNWCQHGSCGSNFHSTKSL